jgi:hypothetical protein
VHYFYLEKRGRNIAVLSVYCHRLTTQLQLINISVLKIFQTARVRLVIWVYLCSRLLLHAANCLRYHTQCHSFSAVICTAYLTIRKFWSVPTRGAFVPRVVLALQGTFICKIALTLRNYGLSHTKCLCALKSEHFYI